MTSKQNNAVKHIVSLYVRAVAQRVALVLPFEELLVGNLV